MILGLRSVENFCDEAEYVPERGDVVWLDLSPQVGHEQAGRRPVVIVSPTEYNRLVRLALVCPITSRRKGYPFEVLLPDGLQVQGVVLAGQLKSVDWEGRRAEFICKVPLDLV